MPHPTQFLPLTNPLKVCGAATPAQAKTRSDSPRMASRECSLQENNQLRRRLMQLIMKIYLIECLTLIHWTEYN
jgi:hypothetical protein